MADPGPAALLAGAGVDAAVFALRPDYRTVLVTVEGLLPVLTDDPSDELLQRATLTRLTEDTTAATAAPKRDSEGDLRC